MCEIQITTQPMNHLIQPDRTNSKRRNHLQPIAINHIQITQIQTSRLRGFDGVATFVEQCGLTQIVLLTNRITQRPHARSTTLIAVSRLITRIPSRNVFHKPRQPIFHRNAINIVAVILHPTIKYRGAFVFVFQPITHRLFDVVVVKERQSAHFQGLQSQLHVVLTDGQTTYHYPHYEDAYSQTHPKVSSNNFDRSNRACSSKIPVIN